MQVLLDDSEFRHLRDVARRKGLTLAEWVRQALRKAAREEPSGVADRKLATVRAAIQHDFPAPDIEQMLEEIERGYHEGTPN